MIITTRYGYVSRDGSHEMWADDKRTLAKALLGGKSEWCGDEHLGGIDKNDEAQLLAFVRGQTTALPQHVRTRIYVYHLVTREEFQAPQ